MTGLTVDFQNPTSHCTECSESLHVVCSLSISLSVHNTLCLSKNPVGSWGDSIILVLSFDGNNYNTVSMIPVFGAF